ncbi:MAG: peptidoglycan-associated lipoprotein [Candidatus Muproteobacteria bacterium RBG_16_60_9]|uniref:Peptidoglycan-associated lipoprotein n=1 Tax=Candidatus Muproteobacteria bacterium RBG_16_60_9 TaxID=1817755 RepID=A0A1F6V6P8_9PROT|nr:MAG: peptidoglycan-associated lipoprotein [Candidatus Muproteobacteria bacterium RBG_16_60_9]
MQTKLGLVLLCAGSLWFSGCATDTSTKGPQVEDKTTAASTTGTQTGSQPLRDSGDTKGGALGGTAAEADLLAKRRVYFEFDSSALDADNRRIVEAHARYLAANSKLRVTLEGHADERGTREYNIALGERRGQAVEKIMRVLGVTAGNLAVTSFGEEKPIAPEHNESAWALNRRVEIIYQ